MKKRIAILAGDGIGPEIMVAALRVLDAVAAKFDHQFQYVEAPIGGAAYDLHGEHFPDATRRICESSAAILFGAVGGPVDQQHLEKWRNCESRALLGIRQAFQLNVNLRPVRVLPDLSELCPLRPERIESGIDILFVRELAGDVYFGEKTRFERGGEQVARDVGEYSESQIAAVAEHAFRAARGRGRKVTSVDKANVLETSKLWREVVQDVATRWPDVSLQHMLVDNCAMQLVRKPAQFDVVLTTNLFGDILSDLAAALPGSLGLMPSASLSGSGLGLYEPAGGSAPDIAGQGLANPLAQILSAAMMLRFSFALDEEANAIEAAVSHALRRGARTADLTSRSTKPCSTSEMTDAVLSAL